MEENMSFMAILLAIQTFFTNNRRIWIYFLRLQNVYSAQDDTYIVPQYGEFTP